MRAPVLNLLLIASVAGASLAQAQTSAPPQTAAVSPDAIKQREQELEAARASKKSAEEAQAKLKAEITSLGQDRTQLNQQLIDTAANVRAVETKIDEAEARLKNEGRDGHRRRSSVLNDVECTRGGRLPEVVRIGMQKESCCRLSPAREKTEMRQRA